MQIPDPLTERIIGCAIEVHRHLGPGLPEAPYEEALCIELRDCGLTYVRQVGVPVTYKGILPDLFKEGKGAVAQGQLVAGGMFVASEVLAKHDETYMPKEVADALKKSGHWSPAKGPAPPASTWNTGALKGSGG